MEIPLFNFVAMDRERRDYYLKENNEILRVWDKKWGFLREEYAKMNCVDLKKVQRAPRPLADEVDKILGIKLPPIPYYPTGAEAWRKPPNTSGFYGYRQKMGSPVAAYLKRYGPDSTPRHDMKYWGITYGTNE